MKKIVKSTVAVVAVAASCLGVQKAFNCNEVMENSLLAENIEALAQSPDNDPWSDCPRDKWIRNAKESWDQHTAQYEAGFGLFIMVNGQKKKVGADVGVGGSVYVPTCPDSSGNCCEKKHLDKPFKYA